MNDKTKIRIDTAMRVVCSLTVPLDKLDYDIKYDDTEHITIVKLVNKYDDFYWCNVNITYENILSSIDKAIFIARPIHEQCVLLSKTVNDPKDYDFNPQMDASPTLPVADLGTGDKGVSD